MRYLIFFSLLLVACAGTGARKLASEGADGDQGVEGAAGQHGRAGSFIVATGCLGYAESSIKEMTGSAQSGMWVNGNIDFLCGASPKVTAEDIARMHALVDARYAKLRTSGYFHGTENKFAGIPVTWQGLHEKITLLNAMHLTLEQISEQELGCADASTSIAGRPPSKFRFCFFVTVQDTLPDGTVKTDLKVTGAQYLDGSLNKYPAISERFRVLGLPQRCENGMPSLTATETATYEGKKVQQKIETGCAELRLTYSGLFDNVVATFE